MKLRHQGPLVVVRPTEGKKKRARQQRDPTELVIARLTGGRKKVGLSFGSVTIEGRAPTSATIERNISLGQSALKRGLTAFVKPGVKIPRGKGVPIYRADPNDPAILIRELNGRHERGRFARGEFKLAK